MKAVPAFAAVASMVMLTLPAGVDSCGIPRVMPVFSARKYPADVDGEFVKGRPGVISADLRAAYLIGAYRMFSGLPFADRKSARRMYPASAPSADVYSTTAQNQWTQAAASLAPAASQSYFGTYRSTRDHAYYANCLDDAFRAAAGTLDARVKLWGKTDARVQEWIAGQRAVFSNCDGNNATLPAEPTAGMDPLLAADRRYQRAAALFYSGDWTGARAAFERIAQEKESPWRSVAPYLIARAYLREGTVEGKPEALRRAAEQFEAVIANPELKDWHEPSRRLLRFVRLRIDSSDRLRELGSLLAAKAEPPPADLVDEFLYLYGRYPQAQPDDAKRLASTSELTDWLFTVTQYNPGHALEQWKSKRSAPWLVAALMAGGGDDGAALLDAARAVPASAPEYESAVYYGIQWHIRNGRRAEARQWADEVLRNQLTRSTRNGILAQRFQLARNWSEFLRYALRRPEAKVQFVWDEETAQRPPVRTGTAPLFDEDAVSALNRKTPLALWMDAASNTMVPAYLQIQLAQSGWIRAVVLARNEEARRLMERIVQLQPQSAAAAQEFLSASDPAAARFAAVLIMLRQPGLKPGLWAGSADAADLSKPDRSGAGYWGFGGCWPNVEPGGRADDKLRAEFPTPQLTAAASAEWKRLEEAARFGANYLAAQAIAWARAHPDDARVPEALHLAVRATRRGCKDEHIGELSKQAFQILHRQYPESEWTTKTPYWFN